MFRIQSVLFAIVTGSGLAAAQSELLKVHGDTLGDEFGAAVAAGGDVDGDGVPDLLIGASADADVAPGGGSVRVVSGKDGAVLRVAHTDAATVEFGSSVAFIGDVDHDGVADFAAGGKTMLADPSLGAATVQLFSGHDGSLLRKWIGSPSHFDDVKAGLVSRVGDVDADGTPDVLVGWNYPFAPTGEPCVQVFSGATGAALQSVDPYFATFNLGRLGEIGDVDLDGFADFADSRVGGYDVVMMPAGFTVSIFSGTTGEVISKFTRSYGNAGGEFLTGAFAGVPDVDGSGTPGIAVAADWSDTFHAYSVSVFLASGGFPIQWWIIPNSAGFPRSIASGGDLNADGLPDIVVGDPSIESGGPGHLLAYSGLDAALLFSFDGAAGQPDFRGAVAIAGDVNGDGRADVLLSTRESAPGLASNESAIVVTAATIPGGGAVVEYGHGCSPSAAQVPHLQFTGLATPGAAVALSLTNVKGGGAALLFLGTSESAVQIPATQCTLNVAPPILALPSWPIASVVAQSGWTSASFRAPPEFTGTLMFQAFLPDAVASHGFVNSNGVAVTLQ